jgi:hypothetical protein
MGMSQQLFYKTHDNARIVAPRPDAHVARKTKPALEQHGPTFEIRGNMRTIVSPDPRGGAPAGSIDLLSLNYPAADAENWGRPARIQDVAATIERSADRLTETICTVIGERMRELRKTTEEKLADLDQRQAATEAENVRLRASIAKLETKHAQLSGQNETLLAMAKREAPPALRITGWNVDSENAVAVPRMSDGSRGAGLPLLALFASLAARFAEAERPKRARAAPRANGAEAERAS